MKKVKLYVCIQNQQVDCEDRTKCATCGWNPIVTERRKERIRGEEVAVRFQLQKLHEDPVRKG